MLNTNFSLRDVMGVSVDGTHCVYVKCAVDVPALFVTYCLVNFTRASANLVTGFGLLLAMASVMSVINENLILASGLFYCSFVLDFVDGKLARLRRAASHFGKKLDLASDRFIFVVSTLAYLYYFEAIDEPILRYSIVTIGMTYLLYDVIESVDSMIWQRKIIEDLLSGRSVEAHFGIDSFRESTPSERGKDAVAYFSAFFVIKKWIPSRLSIAALLFFAAPLLSFEVLYGITAAVLLIRVVWLLRSYFFRVL